MSTPAPPDPAPDRADPTPSGSTRSMVLSGLGIVYLALGLVLGTVWLLGNVDASLFPTGWILPLVLLVSGALMVVRRRFDLVAVLWGGLAFAVFQIDLAVYLDGQALGVSNPAAFDATVIVVALGLLPVVLRPAFRGIRSGT